MEILRKKDERKDRHRKETEKQMQREADTGKGAGNGRQREKEKEKPTRKERGTRETARTIQNQHKRQRWSMNRKTPTQSETEKRHQRCEGKGRENQDT